MAAPHLATPESAPRFRNRLLRALPEQELARIAAALDPMSVQQKQIVFDVDRPIQDVYFPEDAVFSIVGVMSDGTAVETAAVGWEGMVGLPVFLGTDRTAAKAFCQIPGTALRLDTARLRAHDRIGRDQFPLTQRFLSEMLGVRRATVTDAARSLQQAGFISYVHGRVTIHDRRGLEGISCECYAIVRREFERLLEGHVSPSPLDGVRMSDSGSSSTRSVSAASEPTGGIEPLLQ